MSLATRLVSSRYFGAGSAIRAVAVMAMASAAGQIVVLVSLPLLARLYDPIAFGIHALIFSFLGVASVAACMCLELAIVSAPNDAEADELFAGALMSIPVTTTLGGVGLAVLIYLDVFSYGTLPFWTIPIVLLILALNGAYAAGRHRTLRNQDFSAIARASVCQNIGRAVAPFALFPLAPFWAGLTGGELIGRTIGVAGLIRPLWPNCVGTTVWQRPGKWWRLVRYRYRYTAVLLASVLIDATASLLIFPLIAAMYGMSAAGQYFVTNFLLAAPFALVGSAISDVIHVRGANIYHSQPTDLPRFTRLAGLLLLGAASAIYLPLAAIAPSLFPLLLGPDWASVSDIARALTPFVVVAFVAGATSRLLMVVDRPKLKVFSDTVRLVGVPVTIYMSHSMGYHFLGAIWNLSWFLTFAYLLYFLVTHEAVKPKVYRSS